MQQPVLFLHIAQLVLCRLHPLLQQHAVPPKVHDRSILQATRMIHQTASSNKMTYHAWWQRAHLLPLCRRNGAGALTHALLGGRKSNLQGIHLADCCGVLHHLVPPHSSQGGCPCAPKQIDMSKLKRQCTWRS